MDTIFVDVCVLVTAAFAFTLVPGFRQPERSLLSRRDQGTALLVFLVLGLVEEVTVSHAGDRLKVEQTIDPGSLDALMPPFCFQPLVENAVQHGLHSTPGAGRLQLVVRPTGPWLEMSVIDDGQGVASTEVEQLFFGERPRAHALVLLRRRLQGLFGRSFQLEVRSEIGEGTTVTMHLPFRKRLGVNLESKRAVTAEVSELVPS